MLAKEIFSENTIGFHNMVGAATGVRTAILRLRICRGIQVIFDDLQGRGCLSSDLSQKAKDYLLANLSVKAKMTIA